MQSIRTESSIAFHLQFRAGLQTHLLAASRGTEGYRDCGHRGHHHQQENMETGKRFSCHPVEGVSWRENTKKGGSNGGTPSSPRWLRLHFLICDAEMNKTNLSVEDCEELQIKAWNTHKDD